MGRKNIFAVSAIFCAALVLACQPVDNPEDTPPSPGVIVSCTLEATGLPGYGSHAGVYIWITDESGAYVCTLNYYLGQSETQILVHGDDNPDEWTDLTGYTSSSTPDGVSSATCSIGDSVPYIYTSSNWDFTDRFGNPVAAGTYTIHVQVTGHSLPSDYYSGEIVIDGSGKTVSLQKMDAGAFDIMSAGTAVYTTP